MTILLWPRLLLAKGAESTIRWLKSDYIIIYYYITSTKFNLKIK